MPGPKRMQMRGDAAAPCAFSRYAAEVRRLLLVGAGHPGGPLGAANALGQLLALDASRQLLREGWASGWSPAECAATFKAGLRKFQANLARKGVASGVFH